MPPRIGFAMSTGPKAKNIINAKILSEYLLKIMRPHAGQYGF